MGQPHQILVQKFSKKGCGSNSKAICYIRFLTVFFYRFGHVFSADTGASVGEIMGQSKPINSVDFRGDRPFRIVTASEDNTLAFFHGPPFKFQFTMQVRFFCYYCNNNQWNFYNCLNFLKQRSYAIWYFSLT